MWSEADEQKKTIGVLMKMLGLTASTKMEAKVDAL